MRAGDPRVGGLDRIDRVARDVGEVVAEIGELIEIDMREVADAAELRDDRRRKPERGRIEQALVLADVGLLEPRPSGADVEKRARRHGVDVVVGDPVVDAEEIVARRNNPVDLAEDGVAGLAPVVARVAHEQLLLVGQPVIDAGRDGIEVVGPRVRVEEVVPSL